MIRKQYFVALLALVVLAALSTGCTEPTASASDRINVFFEAVYQQELARSPMSQSYLGIKDDYDKWDDISDQRADEDLEILNGHLETMHRDFDMSQLDEQAKLSYHLFEDRVKMAAEGSKWRHHRYPVNQMFGMHSEIPAFLINVHKVTDIEDAEAYVSRLEGIQPLLEQLIVGLKVREEKGILAPKFTFPYVKQDISNILSGRPFYESDVDSPLFEDFRKKLMALKLDQTKQNDLLTRAKLALLASVRPGYEALLTVVHAQEKHASSNEGAWSLPDGDAYYTHALRYSTTTNMSPDEVHQYGLSEVERIHKEMRRIMATVSFEGNLQEFFKFVREDQRFYYADDDMGRQAYLKRSVGYIDIMKARLDEVFNTKPKADIVIKAVESFRQESAGWAFYEQPAIDGSRPGTFYVNLFRMSDNPTYSAEALAYHEGIPGHHMQIAISQELKDVPKFRKFSNGHTAYQEGWGLYSEYLPKEMGFYQNPYSDFGRLSMELWRAIRLVVDTGLHYKRWTREQTIDYHLDNSPNAKEQAVRATERYIVMPGQATAYKIGMRKILELREMARGKLGDAFSIGGYHDVVLKNGSVPLSILEDNVNDWVTATLK